MILDFEPGDKVYNPSKKEWGIGQVQSIIKEKITVNFQNAGKKVINSLADTVFSCMGGTYSQRRVKNEIAPEILRNFKRQDIDCALLVAM